MSEPPKEFRSKGYQYSLLECNSKAALYAQEARSRPGCVVAWEVHKLRWRPPHKAFGTVLNQNVLASDSKWGTYGWTFMSLEAAKKKFKEVSSGTV